MRFRALAASLSALLAAPLLAAAPPIPADAPVDGVLKAYVERERAHASWEMGPSVEMPTELKLLAPGVSIRQIDLVSQDWRGEPWKHRLMVLAPDPSRADPALKGAALLWITGTENFERAAPTALPVAAMLGVPCFILRDVPNQPLLKELDPKGKGFKEDALIATTLVEFQKSGDPDWPLLLPMVRSAVAAMDAAGEFSSKEPPESWPWGKIDRFVVGGASKRGWTTWLTSAVDPRVVAILPTVYDNLNIREQLTLQREQYNGGYSQKIHDYTDRGLIELIETPRGSQAIALIDPWTYRDLIRVPAFMLLATNDEYWAAGGITKYLDGLRNPAWAFYVTNKGHSLGGGLPLGSVLAFVQAGLGVRGLPPSPRVDVEGQSVRVTVEAPPASNGRPAPAVSRVRVWYASSGDTDMRDDRWHEIPALATSEGGDAFVAQLPAEAAASTSTSVTAEVVVRDDRGEYSVFAPLCVVRP